MKIPKRTTTRRILNPVNVSVDAQQERIGITYRDAKEEQLYLEAFQIMSERQARKQKIGDAEDTKKKE